MVVFSNSSFLEPRRNPSKMVNLLECSFTEANLDEYNSILIDAGFVHADINLLGTLAENLRNKLAEPQSFIWNSKSSTETGIPAFNRVWDEMVRISSSAKMIFTDSPALVQYYQLYS